MKKKKNHIKKCEKYNSEKYKILKILFTALKFYLHFRQLHWTSKNGPNNRPVLGSSFMSAGRTSEGKRDSLEIKAPLDDFFRILPWYSTLWVTVRGRGLAQLVQPDQRNVHAINRKVTCTSSVNCDFAT